MLPESALQRYPEYEVVIGIEVHVQLLTRSKIFCACPNLVSQEPNVYICPICAGHPGVLPVLNKEVITCAISAGLATECHIAQCSRFDRKHYFYPDLPKGYQITQQYEPICTQGFIAIRDHNGAIKKIRINRIHIEEDAGKNIHSAASNESFVDLNRAGTPLLEIVSYPDISSSYEAKTYLKELRLIVQYLNICSGSMEEGAFRADTNISVRKKGTTTLGTKCELKNINSFKFIGDAIEYETERQIALLETGGSINQETRLWDPKNRETIVMRKKEEAADYRFFPDPDLPLIEVLPDIIEKIKIEMPELPQQKRHRLITHYNIAYDDAEILIDNKELAQFYEEVMSYFFHPTVINWVIRDVQGCWKEHNLTRAGFRMTPVHLASLIRMVAENVINNRSAQEVFKEVAHSNVDPHIIVEQKGLVQIGSPEELEKVVQELIASHPEVVQDYKSGKTKLMGFFVGQAMKMTAGKGNPKILQEIFKKYMD
jgi:aspartyl-tRNA(Asn)/glutamyl-tRNA(Gln) amidotransferase subunit B